MPEFTSASLWPEALSGLAGALIGGVIALASIWLQLRHARKQSQIERAHDMRREVYLQAAEGMARGLQYLASFARIDVSTVDAAQMVQENPGWFIKVQAVATLETITAISESSEFIASRSLSLGLLKATLQASQVELDALNQRIREMETYSQQLTTALQSLSGPDVPPESRAEGPVILRHFLAIRDQLEAERAGGRALMAKNLKLHRTLILDSLKAAFEYQDRVVPAILQLRKELGFPIAEFEYRRVFKAGSERLMQEFTQALPEDADE